MVIQYTDADGRIHAIEVNEEIGRFYLDSTQAEERNDRRERRRHTSLDILPYEEEPFFAETFDALAQFIDGEAVDALLAQLNPRQRLLIQATLLEGFRFTELALLEGKDEAAIRHAVTRAKRKLQKILKRPSDSSTFPGL